VRLEARPVPGYDAVFNYFVLLIAVVLFLFVISSIVVVRVLVLIGVSRLSAVKIFIKLFFGEGKEHGAFNDCEVNSRHQDGVGRSVRIDVNSWQNLGTILYGKFLS
jgi:hypothetical protein